MIVLTYGIPVRLQPCHSGKTQSKDQVTVTAPPVMAARAVSRIAEVNLDGGRVGVVLDWVVQ